MPKSLFEWDDYIFGLSLHLFAPQADVPQAPFFPLFVYAARFVRRFVSEDVTALSAVSVAASTAAVPLVYAVARELFDAGLALRAAILYAFLPAVWFYAGTPITDTAGAFASLAVFLLALRAMRRAGEPPRGRTLALALAFAAFGVACGVRPQSLVPALLPLAIAWLRADRRGRLIALASGAAAAGACALLPVVVAAGGLAPLLGPIAERVRYTGSSTSLFSGVDWLSVARRWLRDPWVSKWLAAATAALAMTGAVVLDRRDREAGRRSTRLLLVSFAPYAAMCVVLLDPTFGSRYLLPLMPIVAIFVAGAARDLEAAVAHRAPVVTAAYLLACVLLVAPAIRVVHLRPAPAAEAAARLRATAPEPFALLYTEEMFAPTELLFPNVPKFAVEKTSVDALRAATVLPIQRFCVFSMTDPEQVQVPCWPPLAALQRLTPGRYLVVPFGPWSRETPAFGDGWSGEERRPASGCALSVFRWIERSRPARAVFPPLPAGRRIVVEAEPEDGPRPGARLRLLWNGHELARAGLDSAIVRVTGLVPPDTGASGSPGPGELTLLVEPDAAGLPGRIAVTRIAAVEELPQGTAGARGNAASRLH